jgi:UDP:flavonoid glycosyltransferase YjiC (YdhE family)
VLFCVESVTLAQVVRLVVLARSLDPRRYEVHFASGRFDDVCFGGTEFVQHALETLPAEHVLRRVAWGMRPYGYRALRRYVERELELFEHVRPDMVVGDFRLSLSVSARAARVPCMTLINAYWSPYAVRDRWPMPDHPIVRLLGVARAEAHFPRALPVMFGHFVEPLNQVRREFGLPPLAGIEQMLTDGDYTLYPDVPALVKTCDLPDNHRYLGALVWGPDTELPRSLQDASPGKPWVYVTLGSSGDVRALPVVIEALASLPVRVLIATADRATIRRLPEGFYAAPYVPGHLAARRAAFVVSNGGSSTGYQALVEGVPVLGVASNLDQYLAMTSIRDSGAGVLLRAAGVRTRDLIAAARSLLEDPAYRRAAECMKQEFSRYDATRTFHELVSALRPAAHQRSEVPP